MRGRHPEGRRPACNQSTEAGLHAAQHRFNRLLSGRFGHGTGREVVQLCRIGKRNARN